MPPAIEEFSRVQRHFAFSPLDEIMPDMWMALMLCFPCPDDRRDEIGGVLQSGFQLMVQESPFLAGILKKHDTGADGATRRKGALTLDMPDEPLSAHQLHVKDLTQADSGWDHTYDELRKLGFPPSLLDSRKLVPVPYGVASPTNRILEAQANFITGGCILSISTCHTLVDGWGFALIWTKWAECCRRVQNGASLSQSNPNAAVPEEDEDDSHPPALFVDTTSEDYQELKTRPELWQLLGLDWRRHQSLEDGPLPAPQPYHQPKNVRTCIFRLSVDDAAKLKQSSVDGERWVSSNDALIAFLWRSITRARSPGWTKEQLAGNSMVSVAIDGRRHLPTKVPASHIGNVIFCCLTFQPVAKLIPSSDSTASQADVARAIRSSVQGKARNPTLLADAVRLAASIPDLTVDMGNAFTNWFGVDLATSSIADLPFYQLDFGDIFAGSGGKAEFFRMPRGQFDGMCFVHPRHVNGDLDIVVSLLPEEMERLREDPEFLRYMKFLSE